MIKFPNFLILELFTKVHNSSCQSTSGGLPVGSSVRIPLVSFTFESRTRGVESEELLLSADFLTLPSPSVRFSLSHEKSDDFPVGGSRWASSLEFLPRWLAPLAPVDGGLPQSSNAALSLAPALSSRDPMSSRWAHCLALRVGRALSCVRRPDSGGALFLCTEAGRARSEAAQFLEKYCCGWREQGG